ncbi:hypothetical protein ACEQPO_28280 [Bacillus sp. SL00103]
MNWHKQAEKVGAITDFGYQSITFQAELAGSSPEVLLGHLSALRHIYIGSGGVE